MKKRTHEEFIQQVYNIVRDEYTFLEKYTDAKTKIEVVHNICNYKYKITPDGFLNKGTRCPKCAIKNNALKQTKTHDIFVREVFNLVGNEYEFIDSYINSETKIKAKHNKCGCIYEVKPSNFLSGYRCPICCHNPQKIIKGINSMWDTNPELAKLLLDPEDGYNYTYGSSKKVNWKCPNCHTVINNKIISTIYKNGLSCIKC